MLRRKAGAFRKLRLRVIGPLHYRASSKTNLSDAAHFERNDFFASKLNISRMHDSILINISVNYSSFNGEY